MTKQQMIRLFRRLPPSNQPQPNSGHSMLFHLEDAGTIDLVCRMLKAADVKFMHELVDDSYYIIEVQTED